MADDAFVPEQSDKVVFRIACDPVEVEIVERLLFEKVLDSQVAERT